MPIIAPVPNRIPKEYYSVLFDYNSSQGCYLPQQGILIVPDEESIISTFGSYNDNGAEIFRAVEADYACFDPSLYEDKNIKKASIELNEKNAYAANIEQNLEATKLVATYQVAMGGKIIPIYIPFGYNESYCADYNETVDKRYVFSYDKATGVFASNYTADGKKIISFDSETDTPQIYPNLSGSRLLSDYVIRYCGNFVKIETVESGPSGFDPSDVVINFTEDAGASYFVYNATLGIIASSATVSMDGQ